MKKLFPNMSVLTFFTQKKEGDTKEKLLFLYAKPVADHYTDDAPIWLAGKGAKGKAKQVWESISLKQWLAFGSDTQILSLFDEILSVKTIAIEDQSLEFHIPAHSLIQYEKTKLKNRSESTADTLVIDDPSQLPSEFFQRENLKMLSGYNKSNNNIKAIEPPGILEADFIFNNLEQDVIGVKEYRRPYLTFRGVRKTSEKNEGPKEMVGFYQENFDDGATYIATIKNKTNIEIGKGEISKSTGFFKALLSEQTHTGSVAIISNNLEEIAVDYTLIKDIDFNMSVSGTTFKDAYGRSHMIVKKDKEEPKPIKDFTWQKNIYADTQEANKKLSDKFRELFEHLGPEILIADPYFIGGVNKNDLTGEYALTDCQVAFINAVIHAGIDARLKKLDFLGNNTRANNHFDKDDNSDGNKSKQRFDRYEEIFKGFIKASSLESYFPQGSLSFRNASADFHNRYWMSVKTQGDKTIIDKCVIVTNSVGNISEVDIMMVTDEAQLKQITRKYQALFNDAELKLTI